MIEIKEHFLPWVDAEKKITPTAIVLHWWEEPINDQGVQYLADLLEPRGLAVQFAVLANGDIFQLTPTPDTYGRHAKCANDSAIGIEIEGMGAEDLDANEVQFGAVVALTRYLKEKYAIADEFHVDQDSDPMRFYGVTSHKNADVYCPNANGKVDVHDEYLARVIEAVG